LHAQSIGKSFTHEPTIKRSEFTENLNILAWRKMLMEKFAIGDFVAKGTVTGKVAAVFSTTEGQSRYAIESDGAIQFALEAELVPYHSQDKAA
jgi:hypothetical protein